MTARIYGALGEFESPAALFRACEKVRDARYSRWDAHTPFPVHGLDRAMGLPASPLPYFVCVMGLVGAALGMLLQAWTSLDYKVIIAARAYFSWQAFIPVTFELMILSAAGTAVFGMLILNRLPRLHHSLLASTRFKRATDDRFFIAIEAEDQKFDKDQTLKFLSSIGASHVELVEES